MHWIASRRSAFKSLLLVVALAVGLAACAPSVEPSQRILGKWRSNDGLAVQFFENGRMELTYPSEGQLGGSHDSGIWILTPDHKIKVSPEGGTEACALCDITFLDGNRLLVKGQDGASVSMTRE
jgi:hypothetical protein